ncbi:MAG TPA: hypothetical protein VLB74_11205 [Flavobacterium sp.]|uniref:hypothetical protein n=1 Tax=Flavobacterium sp. TaxID=239 RepID=UPI002B79888E|nr:hypothetical protein [Flavobacterium sp.]HSD15206.1 hypothetical protein [Flavobacterium sp.]
MENRNEFEVVVSQGKRHFLEIALAAVFFGVLLYLVGMTIYYAIFNPDLGLFIGNSYNMLSLSGFLIVMGLKFSMVKDVLIDLDENKLVSRYSVGPFEYNKKSEVPDLDYISVFLNLKGNYEVNLWYGKNKHYKMYVYFEKEEAFQFAEQIAAKLKLDLLDATEPGNSKWIEKEVS